MKSSVQHTRTYHQSQHKPVAIIPTHFGTILGSRVRVKVMIRVSLGYGQGWLYSSMVLMHKAITRCDQVSFKCSSTPIAPSLLGSVLLPALLRR
jgi:hypothetical protein